MTNTTNYNLTKQAGNENINIDLISQNMDIIDNELKKRETGQEQAQGRLDALQADASQTGEIIAGHDTAITQLQSDVSTAGEQLTALDAAKAAKSITAPVTLTAADWVEDAENGWWTQGVSNPAIVDGRKVDLSASPAVVKQISEAGATLVLENNAGTATIYSLGAVPTIDLTIELVISEVTEQ